MTIDRRKVLAGMAGLGASTALPAWAQGIMPQRDPYAQVDPYANERGGGWPPDHSAAPPPQSAPAFDGGGARTRPMAARKEGGGKDEPEPLSEEELAAQKLEELLADPEKYEILAARQSMYYNTVARPDKGQGRVIKNAAVQRALWRFSQPFLAIVDRPELPWEIYVTEHPFVNGLAFGGGKVTITAGTIALAETPAEFATLLVHELGHNDRRHIIDTIQTKALLENMRLGQVQSGQATGQALEKMSPVFRKLLENGYSREQEREADAHVPHMFKQLGMDMNGAVTIFRKMMKQYRDDPNVKTCLMDSHPVLIERIGYFSSHVYPVRNAFVPPGWAELKSFFPTPAEYRWS